MHQLLFVLISLAWGIAIAGPCQDHLVGLTTLDSGHVVHIRSPSKTYSTVWEPDQRHPRSVEIIPCVATFPEKSPTFSGLERYIEQEPVRNLVERGAFFRTAPHADSPYALLMTRTGIPDRMGRGGILMFRSEDEWNPVTLEVPTRQGSRRFLLQVKGSGDPEGKLGPIDQLGRVPGGSISSESESEYATYQQAQLEHPLARESFMSRMVRYSENAQGFGQTLIATRSTLRGSFADNEAFRIAKTISSDQMAREAGQEFGRFLGFKTPWVAFNLSAENVLLVETSAGQRAIATDYADILPLHTLPEPFAAVRLGLRVMELSLQPPAGTSFLHQAVLEGLNETSPEASSERVSAEAFMQGFLAERIVDARIRNGTLIDAAALLREAGQYDWIVYNGSNDWGMRRLLERYIAEERQLLQWARKSMEEKAVLIDKSLEELKEIEQGLKSAPRQSPLQPWLEKLPLSLYRPARTR